VQERRSTVKVRQIAFSLGIAFWLLVPVMAIGILLSRSAAATIDPPRAVWTEVDVAGAELQTDVGLGLTWASPSPAVAPAWNGMLQEILVNRGDPVANGTPLFLIDNIQRVAAEMPIPFSGPLAINDSGPAVSALNDFLTTQGFDAQTGDTFTNSTLRAVRDFAATLGVPNSREVDHFDPAWVVFLDSPAVVQSTEEAVVGAPAPSPGTPVIVFEPQVASALLLPASVAASNGTGSASWSDSDAIQADQSQTLRVLAHELPLNETRDRVAPEGLVDLSRLASPEAIAIPGALARAPKANEWVVPSAAIVTGSGGETCVIVGPDQKVPTAITIVAQSTVGVVITGDLDADDRIAIIPPQEAHSCA
jgi:hypothetical protein